MQIFSLTTSQRISLTVLFSVIIILLILMVWSGHDPGECKAYINSNQSTNGPKPEETLWCPSSWLPVTVFTAALVIATVGLWVFTGLLWSSTQRAVRDSQATGKIAIDLAAAANRSAEAAERSIEIATYGMRPFLVVEIHSENIKTEWWSNNNHKLLDIKIRFKNHGKTPAIMTSVNSFVAFSPQTENQEIFIDQPNYIRETSHKISINEDTLIDGGVSRAFGSDPSTLYITGPKPCMFVTHLNEIPDRQRVLHREIFIWIVGRVDYKDLKGADFYTSFCLKYDFIGGRFTYSGGAPFNERA